MGDSWIHDVWVKDARDYEKNEEPVIKLLQATARQCHLRPNNYKAQGVMGATTVQDVYILSGNTTLTHMRSAQMKPFTSFFIPTKRGHAPSSDIQLVYDTSQQVESGIHATSEAVANAPRYNLAGQRVGQDYRGIVVEKGRKTLVK